MSNVAVCVLLALGVGACGFASLAFCVAVDRALASWRRRRAQRRRYIDMTRLTVDDVRSEVRR